MNQAILLLSCPDRTGIVAALSRLISDEGGNIISMDQHSEDSGAFTLRVCWTLEKFRMTADQFLSRLNALKSKFKWSYKLYFTQDEQNIAVLVTKEAHCLYDLLYAHEMNELKGRIRLIISNHPHLRSVADHFSIPFFVVPKAKASKAEAERDEHKLFKDFKIDLIVLAKYMQILSPTFVRKWKDRIINVHHSFLPAFVGPRPYHQAKERGVKVIGATSHYVTEKLDQGPIIAQTVMPVSHRDEVKDLIRKGRDLERQVLTQAVRLHLEHRLLVMGNRSIVFEA